MPICPKVSKPFMNCIIYTNMPTKNQISKRTVKYNKSQIYKIFSDIIRQGNILDAWDFFDRYSTVLKPKKSIFHVFQKKPPDYIRLSLDGKYPYMIQELTEMGFYSNTNIVGYVVNRKQTPINTRMLNTILRIGYIYINKRSDLKVQKQQVLKYMNLCNDILKIYGIRV